MAKVAIMLNLLLCLWKLTSLLRMSGFARCIGREAGRKQEAAGRLFVNSWQAMISCRSKQKKLSHKQTWINVALQQDR